MSKHRYLARAGWVIALLVCGAAASSAQAQQDVSLGPPVSRKGLMSDQLLLLSRKCLTGQEEPQPEQFQAARSLMRLALELNDGDAEAWRLLAELARRLNQNTEELDALRHYCSLRPQDDAAQLDLILRSVSEQQTVEARIAVAERVLDGKGAEGLSAALRSRLASYVAEGAREAGDRERMGRRLRQAASLDPTNRHALMMIRDLVAARGGSAAEMGVALLGLVRADPLDVAARRELGNLLFSQAAYAAAAQQYEVAQQANRAPLDQATYYNWAFCLAAGGRSDDALALLAAVEQHLAGPPATQSAASGAGTAVTTQPAAGDQAGPPKRLPLDFELLRLALYDRSHQEKSAQGSLARIEEMLLQREKDGDQQARADRLWLEALFGEPPGQAFEALAKERGDQDPWVRRMRGWILLRRGATEARALLHDLANRDPFALYGLARLSGKPDQAEAQALLRQVVVMAPTTLAGLLAARDLASSSAPVPASAAGGLLLQRLQELPPNLRQPDYDQHPWIQLDVRVSPRSYRYLQPIFAKVIVRNATDLSLSLGPDGAVKSRLFLYTWPQSSGRSLGGMPPLVEDAGRRLVLGPRQALEMQVRLDRAELGWLLAVTSADRVAFNGLAVLDPRGSGPGNVTLYGPLGATDQIETVERLGLPASATNIQSYLDGLSDADATVQMQAMAWLVQAAVRLSSAEAGQAIVQKITDTVTQRFVGLDSLGQAWAVRFVVADAKGNPMFPRLHEVAQRSKNPLLRMVYLASQVSDPKSPDMDAALREDDPRIVEFAGNLRVTLTVLQAAEAARKKAAPEPEKRR